MWNDSKGVEVTGAFKGFTTPPRELINEIQGRGWTVQSVGWGGDSFVAKAKNPHGETQEGKGVDDASALAHLLTRVMRQEYMRTTAQQKVGMWDLGKVVDRVGQLAQEYAEGSIYEPKAAPAWVELARDSLSRFETLQRQLHIEIVDDPDPYKTPEDMCKDIQEKQHFFVSRANADHPVWTVEEIIAFRAVHDILGHCVAGGSFDWQGEINACAAHFPLLTPFAQKALFVECIMQAAYSAYYRALGPQKVFDPKETFEEFQQNPAGHTGIHPSQSLAPGDIPQVPDPQEYERPDPVVSKKLSSDSLRDPNAEWESGVEPLPDNAYLWHGDPLDSQGALDGARGLDTGWHKLTHPDGTPDNDTMKQAVTNSFRASLLSPRKLPQWAAVHYQDLMHLPPSVTDPKRYWDTLEARRESWNQSQGMAPGAHKPYWAEQQGFRQYIKGMYPDLTDEQIYQKADQEFQHMWSEEEERILSDDRDGRLDGRKIEQMVSQAMKKRLKLIIKPKIDPAQDFDSDRMFIEANDQGTEQYEPWLGSHLKSIGQVSRYSDDLLKAALTDINDHGGSGHHFRSTALSLGIPGVGAKPISFAWHLLQPMTSQLATMDPHTMEALGHDYNKDMSNRDYFKYERELAAGRDAAGYGHVPLNQFQKSLWTLKRGDAQDHSPLRSLNPTPHQHVDWSNQLAPPNEWLPPDWWEATLPFREQAGKDWDQSIAIGHPKDSVPFQQKVPVMAKTAAEGRSPYFTHPDTGEVHMGAPGASLMQHIKDTMGLDTAGVWAGDWGDLGKR